jgi:hypothetical protein
MILQKKGQKHTVRKYDFAENGKRLTARGMSQ